MMKLSAKFRVCLGLVGIIISAIMIASYLGIIPDSISQARKDRATLAETIAIYSSSLVEKAKAKRILDDFDLILERNNDLLSIGLRRENGTLYCATGGHKDEWQEMSGDYSSSSQLRVPIWSGKKTWGQLELRFVSTSSDFLWGLWDNPMLRIVIFISLVCGVIFYFYLGKVLRQLDPSQAIPGRVRTALDTMTEGLLILDKKEHIVLANKAFAEMFDKDSMDLMGFKASEFPWKNRQGENVVKSERPWVKALSLGKIQKDNMLWLQLSETSIKTFKVNCSPVLGEGNKYAGVLISFDDITVLEEKEVELRKSKDEAEQANQTKSAFLANMSHEIRTPMNAILGFTEILKRGFVKNETESLKYLNTIHSSGKNLLDLINDILDLSKVEAGKIEFEKIPFQPYTIIHQVVLMLQQAAQKKNVTLRWKTTTPVPEEIFSDPARFRQILFNLTGNAVKFTEHGSVDIHCSFEKKDSTPFLHIAIKDTGIGMAADTLEKVFDPFGQADATVSRRFGGTGLGLSISHKFAQAMGGDIEVTSREGVGSTFTLLLPIGKTGSSRFLQPEEVALLKQAVESTETSSWKFSGGKVLVVDDGAENRELVKVVLEEVGLTVVEAENGQIGVDKVLSDSFDLVLMDIQMPVMDGFTAARLMRKKGIEIPIIALTANAMKGFEEECLANGYSGYASKPINIDKLMQLVAKYLGEDSTIENVSSQAVEVSIAGGGTTVADSVKYPINPIVSRLASHPKLHKVIIKFIDKLDLEIERLNRSASDKNYAEIAERAHWLKGAAGTVGFDAFTEPAQLLEIASKSADEQKVNLQLQKINALFHTIVRPDDSGKNKAPSDTTTQLTHAPSMSGIDIVDENSQPIVSRLATHPKLKNTLLKFIDKVREEMVLMEKALVEERLDDLQTMTHWLKGAAGTVGYDAFTKPAIELENLIRKQEKEKIIHQVHKLREMVGNIVSPK